MPPNRIDLLCDTGDISFSEAWKRKEEGRYGDVIAHWLDLGTLIDMKRGIDDPRHREDVRVLEAVRRQRSEADDS